MSTKALESNLIPAQAGLGGGNGPMSKLLAVLSAFTAGRSAAAEYRRQVAQGIDPVKAVHSAFARSGMRV
ncbi:MAG TPA: hypothetical protein VFV47_11445 [Hyphomicrobiaceae bacterium]|nr:hypothetical protein [Hyphomicrobiaceae bacterium]